MNPQSTYLKSLTSQPNSASSYLSSLFAKNEKKKTTAPTSGVLSQYFKPNTSFMTPANATAVSPTSQTNVTTPQNTAKNNYITNLTTTTPSIQSSSTQTNDQSPAQTTTGTTLASSGTPNDPMTNYLKSYRDYIAQYASSLKPSDELNEARVKLAEVQNKIDERTLAARREYVSTLRAPGMLKSGAEAAARDVDFRNDQNLADLGVQESGAARLVSALSGNESARSDALKTQIDLNKPLEIAGKLYDPTTGNLISEGEGKAGFSLSEGEARYEINPQTGKYELIASRGKTYAPTGVTPGVAGGELSSLARAVLNGTIAKIGRAHV